MKTDLSERFYNFALNIVSLVRNLPGEMATYEIGRQLLRSGTSIAANYEEAKGGFSKDDFIYRINIAFKESRETTFWLKLLEDSGIVKSGDISSLRKESEEIRNILSTCLKTAKGNKRKTN